MGNRAATKFWLARWVLDRPMYAKYPELFVVASDPDILVRDALSNVSCNITFLRNINVAERVSWDTLLVDLTTGTLSHADVISRL